ncbi:MAG: tetratricopeptide repeat protein, partial [Pseudomonadota bacterium]|nr:tetratricopeptide repeat protein [Pseudomonadota bacterium]
LAMLLLDAGKTARAVELLQAAADKAPDSPEINYHLAQALEKSGARDKAKSLLERILASGKKFPEESEARALLAQLKK